jgi:hypothetical protein
MQQVEGYLAWKWGIQNNLPISHPYYSINLYQSTMYKNINYQFVSLVTNANIYQKKLNIIFTALPKIYNTLTPGQSIYTISGIAVGDIIDISNIYTTTFVDFNVGNNMNVYINYINLIGTRYFNYYIDTSATILGNIIPSRLIPNFVSLGKVYDRNSYASVIYNLSGLFDIDLGLVDISAVWMANYKDVNVNIGIPIDISNIKIYGDSRVVKNYYIDSRNTISGIITKRYLYSIGNDKNYF